MMTGRALSIPSHSHCMHYDYDLIQIYKGARSSVVVKALIYNPEGRVFEPR
jgi:hypothetical protein